ARVSATVLMVIFGLWPHLMAVADQNITFKDDAELFSVADRQAVQDASQQAPFGLLVWTANGGYSDNKAGFVQAADGLVAGDQVVVAVDPKDHWSHVAARQWTQLTASNMQDAQSSANASFANARWRDGIVGAVQSLKNALFAVPGPGQAPPVGGRLLPGDQPAPFGTAPRAPDSAE